ncbi:MAG TPA: hypothetical protein VIJ60_04115, partial [Acidimicrobiales bacterium]
MEAATASLPLAPGEDRSAPARLLSLNVGMPRDVQWQGRTVHTGIWKDPVEGPRMVTGLNVDGDGQGDLKGHGGVNRAVFVYQIGSRPAVLISAGVGATP